MVSIKALLAKIFLRRKVLYRIPRSSKVFLTFDDGPNARCTGQVLDVLDRHDVKATFFMVGRDVRLNEALAREVVKRGHVLGNHSLTHPRMDRMSGTARQLEIESMDRLMATFGSAYRPTLFRPPYGYVSVGLVRVVMRLGRTMVMWSRDSFDFKHGIEEVVAEFERRPPVAGDILLFHDDSPAAAPALNVLLPRWKASGLKFDVLMGAGTVGAVQGI